MAGPVAVDAQDALAGDEAVEDGRAVAFEGDAAVHEEALGLVADRSEGTVMLGLLGLVGCWGRGAAGEGGAAEAGREGLTPPILLDSAGAGMVKGKLARPILPVGSAGDP
mmetsp:Transcript_16115/g.43950  ORF Transcript_16115/g.43950 Transcript_16115/m.43950 type:complete len:110 (+) Transcript_16115:1510-1839(+)